MPVTRSALASRAARLDRVEVGAVDQPLAAPAIRPACATRSTLSATVPSFSWKTIWSSFFACSASGTLRSCSQKNLASDRRAASTFSLPATIAAPPIAGRRCWRRRRSGCESLPVLVLAGEIFLVGPHGELDHLGRHVEEGRVEAALQRHRPFGQPGILGDQPLVRDQRQAGLRCGFARRPRG